MKNMIQDVQVWNTSLSTTNNQVAANTSWLGKTLTATLLLLTLSIGQMWGATWSFSGTSYMYFYNKAGWTDSGKMLFIGKDSYSAVYSMSAVTNTKLWVVQLPSSGWSDASYMAIAGGSNVWGSDYWGPNNRTNATHYTNTYTSGISASNTQYYTFTPASTSNNANISLNYEGTGITSMNKTITVKAKVSTNNGSSYSEATSPGTLSASSKKFTAYNTCNTATSLSSGTITCGYTATTTLTAPSTNPTGYTFVGWYNSSGTQQTTSNSLTIYPTANATYYAYYKANQNTVTLDNRSATTAGTTSVTATYGVALSSITCPTKTNYTFGGYYTSTDGGGTQVIDANGNWKTSVSDYTDSDGKWIGTAAKTIYAYWKQTFSVTYYANFPSGATTSGSVPTDATEYISGATVTVKTNSNSLAATGYTFNGWNTADDGSGTARAAGSTFSITANVSLYAQWTENMTTVTINADPTGTATLTVGGASFTEGNTTTAGVATSRTVVATAVPGYKWSSWTKSGNAAGSNSTNTYTLKGNGNGGTGTLTSKQIRTYAFIEGRFHVTNSSRNDTWTNTFTSGDWNESSTSIAFDYDATNHRFYRHTFATPKELTTTISGYNPYFYIKTSTSSSSLSNVTSYWSSASTTITTAGTGGKKTLIHSGTLDNDNLRFNSTDESGYVILYFDEAGVWYELEQTLQYNGNGSTSGSAPASLTYYNKGTNATAASNTYTRTGYSFAGWNTKANGSGTSYAAGAPVPMNSNITLYAQWTDIT